MGEEDLKSDPALIGLKEGPPEESPPEMEEAMEKLDKLDRAKEEAKSRALREKKVASGIVQARFWGSIEPGGSSKGRIKVPDKGERDRREKKRLIEIATKERTKKQETSKRGREGT